MHEIPSCIFFLCDSRHDERSCSEAFYYKAYPNKSAVIFHRNNSLSNLLLYFTLTIAPIKSVAVFGSLWYIFSDLWHGTFVPSLAGLIPEEILARGQKARAAYKRALQKGRTRDTRVRFMVIGQDRVGKTSLKRSLKGERFDWNEASTDGVEIDRPLEHVGAGPWMQYVSRHSEFDRKAAHLVANELQRTGSSSESLEASSSLVTSKLESVFCEDIADGKNDKHHDMICTESEETATKQRGTAANVALLCRTTFMFGFRGSIQLQSPRYFLFLFGLVAWFVLLVLFCLSCICLGA